jgi:pilus assembly protein CpaB
LNKSFTILVVLALFLGLGSLFLIRKLVESEKAKALANAPAQTPTKQVETRDVLFVKDNLETGTPLTDLNVGVTKVPVDLVPESALTSLDQIKDRFAMQNLFKGEFLLDGKARTRDQLPKASLMITPGKRLISVRVDEVKASGFMIKNGDFVDLVGSFEVKEEMLAPGSELPIGSRITVTFLQRVRVFDIIHGISGASAGDEQSNQRLAQGTTATFEVTPEEADIISNAETIASSLWLVLRRFDDEAVRAQRSPLEEKIIASLKRTNIKAPPPPPEPTKAPAQRKTVF